MPSLRQRLKERKLFQWALAYLAGAWLIFQGIEVLAEPWNLSEAIQRTIHVLLGIGFLVTLVLAWYHGEKGRQRASGVELLILAGILVIAGAAVAVLGRGSQQRSAGEYEAPSGTLDEMSIAVLPFANRSELQADEYFTDGMHDEILTRLFEIRALSVRGRTSVMQYRDSPKNLRDIGRELNARYILEGGVQRAGGSVRINLQLLDTERDEHVWAEMYDRPLTVENLLAVQSEVALRVAQALKATLTADEAERIEQGLTDNTEAYDYYLRGNQYAVGVEASLRIAVEMYEQAVELDPSFALAHAKLSVTHSRIYWFYYDRSENRRMQAKEAVDRVIALGSESPEAHEALGYFYYHGRDYERAAAEFNKILSKQPANSEALLALSFVRRRQGDFEEALALLNRALDLDPRSSHYLKELGVSYTLLRNYEQAAEHSELAMALRPDWPDPYSWYGYLQLLWLGAPDSARAVLEQASSRAGTVDPYYQWVWTRVELCDRDLNRALQRVEQAPDVLGDQPFYLPKVLLFAEAHYLLGDSGLAREYYDSARAFLEPKVLEQPEDWRRQSALGVAYAGLGRREEAIQEGRLAVELMPVARDAIAGTYPLEHLARIYAMVGEYEAAVEQLDRLLSIPSEISVPLLRIDPTWDALRDHPRFQALLAEH
jgi:serine/threonine-protein kinase